MERLVKKLYEQYVKQNERALLDFIFCGPRTQERLDHCLQHCDIEALGDAKTLMLSYVMLEKPDLVFSDHTGPRIKGLIDFYKFKNLRILAHCSKIGKALNEAGIPLLLFKGAAMKALRPRLPRPMGDADVLIPAERMAEALRLCKGLGYHDGRTGSPHAVDLYTKDDKNTVDLHRAVFESKQDLRTFHKNLFARARECRVFGVRALIPAREDLFFLALANLVRNLRGHTSPHGIFYALFDCPFLLASGDGHFDWEIVRADARDTGKELDLVFATRFVEVMTPGLLPELNRYFPLTGKAEDFYNQLLFNENHYMPLAEECRKILVVQLKNYPWHFGRKIARFLFLKQIRRSAALMRWYLKSKGHQGEWYACR
jgi:hypothetical protein